MKMQSLGSNLVDKLSTISNEIIELVYNEGNYHQWKNEKTKYVCEMIRPVSFGHWCGYVRVPSTHAYYGKDFDDVPVTVHGGLTYGKKDECGKRAWWFGFDCAHGGDLVPIFGRMFGGETYRTKQDVIEETNSLAEQLWEIRYNAK
jgi:hypothetical protein